MDTNATTGRQYTVPSETAIRLALGVNTKWEIKAFDPNFQVKFSNAHLRDLSDLEKIEALAKAARKLQAAGFLAEVQLSHKSTTDKLASGKDYYVPYPCIWVNKEARVDVRQEASKVPEMEQKFHLLVAAVKAAGIDVSGILGGSSTSTSTGAGQATEGQDGVVANDQDLF